VVGDPFKDTSSVTLNPVIKFTTLFGLLAVELAVEMAPGLRMICGLRLFAVSMIFVLRSLYSMRIGEVGVPEAAAAAGPSVTKLAS
jgi:K(+)-stimulated pyrophosphate-energized sodium pump